MAEKIIIGRDVEVDFDGEINAVPAKVDTGADGSAVWASDIFVDQDNLLHFKLFSKKSKYYTGKEHVVSDYRVAMTRSSLGDTMMKYRVKLPITIKGRKIQASFGLSDRSTHRYPILIGRRTLHGKFLVDVSMTENLVNHKTPTTNKLNEEMKQDPYKFYKENYLNGASEK